MSPKDAALHCAAICEGFYSPDYPFIAAKIREFAATLPATEVGDAPVEKAKRAEMLEEALQNLVSAYSEKHSPQHRRARLAEARAVLRNSGMQYPEDCDLKGGATDRGAPSADDAGWSRTMNYGAAPDEALIEEIAKRCNTDWWNSRAADVVGICKTAIREYIRRSAGKEKG